MDPQEWVTGGGNCGACRPQVVRPRGQNVVLSDVVDGVSRLENEAQGKRKIATCWRVQRRKKQSWFWIFVRPLRGLRHTNIGVLAVQIYMGTCMKENNSPLHMGQ